MDSLVGKELLSNSQGQTLATAVCNDKHLGERNRKCHSGAL